MSRLATFALIAGSCIVASAANEPSAAERQDLEMRTQALREQVAALQKGEADERAIADVAVCVKAAEWILRHNEWFKPDYKTKAAKTLGIGEQRAAALKQGKPDWLQQPGGVALGYVSLVDESVQPYALTFPEDYSPAGSKRWPLYVVLHGRNGNLTEASFIADFNGKKPPKADYVQLDVYGRGNNAYRWAGEIDVFEAIEDARKRIRIDERRIVLWGFSMGGAGAWHLGMHYPDRWAAAGAGAGFVDYYRYQKKTTKLPPYQDKTLAIYDTVNYALNAADVPFVTYGGDQDPQLLASKTMLEAADPLGVEIESIVGKDVGHKFTPEGEAAFRAFLAEQEKEGRPLPSQRKHIRFTTSTLKYNRCGWVTIEAVDEMYVPATVEAKVNDDEGVAVVTTTNIVMLRLARDAADEVEIDGDRLPLRDAADGLLPDVWYVRDGDGWRVLNYDDSREAIGNPEGHKRHDLQGPIDDAFMESFIVVKGTGTPWSAAHQKYADWSLARFEREFDKWMRGKVRVVTPDDVTPEMIESNNLVLFGDPGSNELIAKVLPELPLEWTKTTLNVAGKSYDPNSHAAVLVFPNPLNPHRYVVLNSGHTFHEDAFEGTNALLFPRLGDIAVLKTTEDAKDGFKEETAWAGLFDVSWELAE